VIAAPPHSPLIPAQAGIQNLFKRLGRSVWVPAFAGTNGSERLFRDVQGARFHPLPEHQQRRFAGRVALGLPIDG
jgi:hypothetical protein